MNGKIIARGVFNTFGLNVTRHRPKANRLGIDAMADIRKLLGRVEHPVVFDVGANTSQSVARFSQLLPGCLIHAFEPSPTAFEQLQKNTRRIRNVWLCNAGVGSTPRTQVLVENDQSDMSSFLKPGKTLWGTIIKETPVPVITLDDYCAENNVASIDLLKSDTQGYELEVLKGAATLIADKQIRLVYLEVIFSEMYQGLPRFDDLYGFLIDHGFRLIAFYNLVVQDGVAAWCDALFRLE